MTFLEHGDIRKSGRAMLIASTIFVLLNECSEVFDKVVLFGFEVRITHEMLLGFLEVGIWVLCGIFAIRFFQGYAAWDEVFSGTKAAKQRTSALHDELDKSFKETDTKAEAMKLAQPHSNNIEREKTVRSKYRQFYFRYAGDIIDTLLLQLMLPLFAVVYAFWVSPALTLVCKAVA